MYVFSYGFGPHTNGCPLSPLSEMEKVIFLIILTFFMKQQGPTQ